MDDVSIKNGTDKGKQPAEQDEIGRDLEKMGMSDTPLTRKMAEMARAFYSLPEDEQHKYMDRLQAITDVTVEQAQERAANAYLIARANKPRTVITEESKTVHCSPWIAALIKWLAESVAVASLGYDDPDFMKLGIADESLSESLAGAMRPGDPSELINQRTILQAMITLIDTEVYYSVFGYGDERTAASHAAAKVKQQEFTSEALTNVLLAVASGARAWQHTIKADGERLSLAESLLCGLEETATADKLETLLGVRKVIDSLSEAVGKYAGTSAVRLADARADDAEKALDKALSQAGKPADSHSSINSINSVQEAEPSKPAASVQPAKRPARPQAHQTVHAPGSKAVNNQAPSIY